MPTDPHPKFDDPALKEALKRACGGEKAPPGLRARIVGALDAERAVVASHSIPARRSWRTSPLIGLAAAAMIVLGIGLIYTAITSNGTQVAQVNLPSQLAQAMVITADMGTAGVAANLVQDTASPNYTGLARKLGGELNYPVLATPLGPEWTLKSAGVAQVSNEPVSQLLFTRGGDAVSLFSIKGARFYATQEGSEYDQMQDGHAIAGFVHKGAIHCVVGSKNMSRKEVVKMRDRLRKTFTASTGSNT